MGRASGWSLRQVGEHRLLLRGGRGLQPALSRWGGQAPGPGQCPGGRGKRLDPGSAGWAGLAAGPWECRMGRASGWTRAVSRWDGTAGRAGASTSAAGELISRSRRTSASARGKFRRTSAPSPASTPSGRCLVKMSVWGWRLGGWMSGFIASGRRGCLGLCCGLVRLMGSRIGCCPMVVWICSGSRVSWRWLGRTVGRMWGWPRQGCGSRG
jgi:hypothetical protein